VLVEVVLELLVGIVDTELLKTVPLEVFKPKDVQDPDGQALGDRMQLLPKGPPVVAIFESWLFFSISGAEMEPRPRAGSPSAPQPGCGGWGEEGDPWTV
jgi:hypothetical protein